MKQILAILFLFLLFNAHAQVEIEVTTDSVRISDEMKPAYIVLIPEAELKPVKNKWTRKIRSKTKSKLNIQDNEISIEGTYINTIYSSPIDIYSFLYEIDNQVKLVSLFKIDSVFFTYTDPQDVSQERIHYGIIKFMKEFAIEEYQNNINKEIFKEESKLQALNKELRKLEDKIEAYKKEIMTNEQRIQNSEDKIFSLEKDNNRKIDQIDRKKDAIAEIMDDDDLRKVAKDQLKTLEKDKKKIEKNLEKERKQVIEYESNIFQINRKINEINVDYEKKESEIEAQNQLIESIKTKLEIQ